MGFDAPDFEETARSAGFSLQDRSERLTLEQFAALYSAAEAQS
jgi:hypothetical protein